MEDFIKGIVIAKNEGLITKKLAIAYISVFVCKKYNVCFSEEELEKINSTS